MAIHKFFSKFLLIQTYHTTCVSFSCQFIQTHKLFTSFVRLMSFLSRSIIENFDDIDDIVNVWNSLF